MIQMEDTRDRVSYEEAGVHFGKSADTIRKWIVKSEGAIKSYPGRSPVDRKRYVSIREIEQWLRGEQQAQDS